MHHKNIIYGCIILIVLSFICLTIRVNQAKDANVNKNWWVLSFVQPDSDVLDFTIENHTNSTQFTYEIQQPNNEPLKRTLVIEKGDTKEVSVASSSESSSDETRITVWTQENDKKEISK
jgi:hypothetical protein